MNERIRELAEQAGIEFDDDFPLEPETIYYLKLSDFDKFAELIVKDFQKLIKDAYLNTSPEHRDCLLMLDARVEEHFGVEV